MQIQLTFHYSDYWTNGEDQNKPHEWEAVSYTHLDVYKRQGVANVVFTFVAIYTVERLGRRALMLFGAGGLAGIYLILGTCYFFEVSGFFMVVLVVLAIACYAMSQMCIRDRMNMVMWY